MTPLQELHERRAEAMWHAESLRARNALRLIEWSDENESTKDVHRANAHAIYASDTAAGIAVVPRKATNEMRIAMHRALYHWREKQGDPQQDPTNDQKHAIRWAAAIAACPYVENPDE